MRSLAEQMTPRVTAQAISKYESGKMLPSSAVLVALGKTLDVSLDFLMSAQIEALEGLEFRKHFKATGRDLAMAEAVLIDNLERYLAIEDILDMPANVEWVEGRRYVSVATEGQIDTRADELREAWSLGLDPIPSLCELLEIKGIKVVVDDLPERINGLACHVIRGGKPVGEAVVVSNRVNVERKRFTLAHELAHRIIRSTGNQAITLGERYESLRWCLSRSTSASPGGRWRQPPPHYLLRDYPPQAHLRRLGGDHADASWADWGPACRRHPTGVRDFRALLAQD